MKLRTRTWIILALLATLAVVCACWSASGGTDIVLPQQQLQQKIDAKLPFVTKNGITVSQAQLDLTGDKIGLTVAASATRLHRTYGIKAQTQGTLRYDNDRGAFFFAPSALKVIDVNAGDVSVQSKASVLFDKLVTSEKLRADKEVIMAEVAEFAQKSVQHGADYALERVPVYTLPDNLKGTVVRMALTSVEVKNGSVIAHISFLHFGGIVLVYIGMFLLVLVVGGVLVFAAASGVELPFLFL